MLHFPEGTFANVSAKLSRQFRPKKNRSDILPVLEAAPQREGGMTAWCTLLGGWLVLFGTFGYSASFGVYQDFLTRAHTGSPSQISWIGSTQLFFMVVMGLPAGHLLDKGYFKATMLVGTVIFILCLFMLSLAKPDRYYQIFLAQGVGMGIGSGLIYAPALTVQAHHWREKRGMAMGLVLTGTSVGGIVYPIMLNQLFHGSAGFAWGVRASAFLTAVLLVAANCLMSARLPGKGDSETAEGVLFKLRGIFTDVPFLLAVAGVFLVVWGVFFPYFYLQLFTVLHGIDPNFAFYALTIQSGASIVGRIVTGLMADRLGPVNVLIVISFATGVMVFTLFGVTNMGGVVAFAIFNGFFSGGVLCVFAPAMSSFSRDVSEVGVRMGVSFFICAFAFLTGTPIDGALLTDHTGVHWFKPIIYSGTSILLSVPLLMMGRAMQAKRKATRYV